jgi:eukaryotic-like serine/threonine-protein kinase
MGESNRCERCGGPLPKSDVVGGGCPRCLLELGYETRSGTGNDDGHAALPKSIGRYRILRVIGEGGMGIVYEAEQDQPRRTVALKIIKHGMSSPELLRRFEQESQALGRLHRADLRGRYRG